MKKKNITLAYLQKENDRTALMYLVHVEVMHTFELSVFSADFT